MISGLPAELIDELCSYLSPGDLAQLSQTNRRLSLHSQRRLYRKVGLASCLAVARFCHSLLRNGALAPLVKRLKISSREPIHGLLTGYARLIARVAPSLVNLAVLSAPYAPRAFHGLSTTHFPRLTDCTIPNSNDVPEFLRRNRTLVDLTIKDLVAWHPMAETLGLFELYGPFPQKPISLHALRSYTGPPWTALWFSRKRCSALILTPASQALSRQPAAAQLIRPLGSRALSVITYSPRDWTCPTLISALHESFPNLRCVTMRVRQPEGWEVFLASFEAALTSFKKLEAIGLNDRRYTPWNLPDEDQRIRAVAWAAKCPTLRVLYLADSHYLRHSVPGGYEWRPTEFLALHLPQCTPIV
ncbi:hypothetical protein MKEN_00536200 [Mycena kentingensis (nom. inval.)]|nr:hypothetical protein MKEN_00536200 [Mycena kentingensis (nom. inval.)]